MGTWDCGRVDKGMCVVSRWQQQSSPGRALYIPRGEVCHCSLVETCILSATITLKGIIRFTQAVPLVVDTETHETTAKASQPESSQGQDQILRLLS